MSRRRAARSVSANELAEAVGGQVLGDGSTAISGISNLEGAGPGDLSFVAGDQFLDAARSSRAGVLLSHRTIEGVSCPLILADNPRHAFAVLVERFFLPPRQIRGISDDAARGENVSIGAEASIWPLAALGDRIRLGNRATIFPGVFIGDDVVIGDDCTLHANVSVGEGCVIGDRVTIHAGTVIGGDGFGYVLHEGRHQKVPQIGCVVIEDDVEIGANVTIDRATFSETRIGRGTKIDNLVQIAHNVEIGPHGIIVAQVGISGSTNLGTGVIIGGQAGIGEHLRIGDRAMIAARSGVNLSLSDGEIVSGAPAMPHSTSIKAHAVIPRLPEMRRKLRALEKRVRELESEATSEDS